MRNNVTRRYPAMPVLTSVMKAVEEGAREQDDCDCDDFIDFGDDLTYVGKCIILGDTARD